MRKEFGKTICELAQEDKDIYLLSGDYGYQIIDEFKEKFPNRFLNLGICEQSLIGVAAGMALEGLKPYVYSITPFITERPFEQLKLDINQQNLNVTLVGYDDYPTAGPTHKAQDAKKLMSILENFTCYYPKNSKETREALLESHKYQGPTFIGLKKDKSQNQPPETNPKKTENNSLLKQNRLYNRARTLYYMLRIKALRKPRHPFYVNLVINAQCNLRCAYCFGKYSNRSQSYWKIDDLKKLIDDLYERGTRYVLIQGGEPLLHPNIREIFSYLNKKNIVSAIVTNGTLPQKIKEVPELELLDNICFSLDGNKEGNDNVRGQGTFDKIMESIKVVKKNFSTPIRINSTIHKYVIQDVDFMAEFMKKNNIEWGVCYLFRGDEKLGEEDLAPTDEQINHYQRKVLEYKKKGYPIFTGTKILEYTLNWPAGYKKIFLNKEEAKKQLAKKAIHCQYGNYEIVIDEDGLVYPCQGMQGVFNAKNIHEVGFDEAFKHLKTKPCDTCYLPAMINTSAMINWDLNVIWDTIYHTLKNRFSKNIKSNLRKST